MIIDYNYFKRLGNGIMLLQLPYNNDTKLKINKY